jgi:hypothetical protein
MNDYDENGEYINYNQDQDSNNENDDKFNQHPCCTMDEIKNIQMMIMKAIESKSIITTTERKNFQHLIICNNKNNDDHNDISIIIDLIFLQMKRGGGDSNNDNLIESYIQKLKIMRNMARLTFKKLLDAEKLDNDNIHNEYLHNLHIVAFTNFSQNFLLYKNELEKFLKLIEFLHKNSISENIIVVDNPKLKDHNKDHNNINISNIIKILRECSQILSLPPHHQLIEIVPHILAYSLKLTFHSLV